MYKLKIVELPKPLNIKTQINFPEVVLGKMQEKTIIPKTTFQEVLPDKNYDGLSKVNVEAVTNEIDENIKSENIKKDVSILGVQGNVEELKGTKLEITTNGTYTPEEPYNAYTEVSANVSADVSDYFTETISSGDSTTPGWFKTIKKFPIFGVSGTSASHMFYNCPLETITVPDTSNVTNMANMFNRALKLKSINVPQMSKVTNCYQMFNDCSNIQIINLGDTSKVTNMSSMFMSCKKLESITGLDTSSCTNFTRTFATCKALTTLPKLNASSANKLSQMFISCNALTTLGGFENLGQAYLTTSSANYDYYTLDLSSHTKLTHESLMNVINNLYDIATKGCNAQKLILGSTNLAKLSDEEKVIATNKGWVLS